MQNENRSVSVGTLADDRPATQGGRHRLTLLTLCLAVLVAQLDTSVVNLALRPIGAYFHAEIGPLQWVVDSYNLLYAILLLTGGLLADLYGLTGLGMGLATGPLMGAAVSAARSRTAAALINVARMAGATIGVAILGAVAWTTTRTA